MSGQKFWFTVYVSGGPTGDSIAAGSGWDLNGALETLRENLERKDRDSYDKSCACQEAAREVSKFL